MEVENIVDAESYINTALGLAKKKGLDYSNYQILDQRIRLFLLKNSKISGPPSLLEISTALDDLSILMKRPEYEAVYPLRSAQYVLALLDEKIDYLDGAIRARIAETLAKMQAMLPVDKLARAQRGETEKIRNTLRKAQLVLQNA